MSPVGYPVPCVVENSQRCVCDSRSDAPQPCLTRLPVCLGQDRVGKHQSVCRRSSRPRPVFDAAAQRAADSSAMASGGSGLFGAPPPLPRGRAGRSRATPSRQRGAPTQGGRASKWRQQHAQLQAAMRAARGGGGRAFDAATAPEVAGPGDASDVGEFSHDARVPCPHCSRMFSEAASERHVPICKNVVNKPAHARSRIASGAGAAAAAALRRNRMPATPVRAHGSGRGERPSLVVSRPRTSAGAGGAGKAASEPVLRGRRATTSHGRSLRSSGATRHSARRKPVPSAHVPTASFGATTFGSGVRFAAPRSAQERPERGRDAAIWGHTQGGGRILTTNATSVGNPLASSVYQTMERAAPGRGGRAARGWSGGF